MFSSTLSRTVVATLILLAFGAGCGGGQQTKIELTPKFTRAVHPVDAANSQIISDANFQKIADGMTQEQVRAIFGTKQPVVDKYKPDEEYELVWQSGGKEIAVKFRGDKSISKTQKEVSPGK